MINKIVMLPASEIVVDVSRVSAIGESWFIVDGEQVGGLRSADLLFLRRALRGYSEAIVGGRDGSVSRACVAAFVGGVGVDGLVHVGSIGVGDSIKSLEFDLLGVEGKFKLMLQWVE